jgi:protease-4
MARSDSPQTNHTENSGWERKLVETLATDALKEKRRARYWGIFFKLFFIAYLIALLVLLTPDTVDFQTKITQEHTAMVKLDGAITSDESGTDADAIIKGLKSAFADKGTQAVILRINSPGGLPVQSSYIQKEILRLRELHPEIPLYAVVSDMCASGAYYVASAADRIYVNESSIIGSIGVRLDSFGLTGAMKALGVERRLYTAGEHKGILDPFSPISAFEHNHTQQILDALHQTFIQAVKNGRGDKLSDNPELFSGLFWDGERSIVLGLADEIGDANYVAREVVGQAEIVDFTPKEDPIERLVKRAGLAVSSHLAHLFGMGFSPKL